MSAELLAKIEKLEIKLAESYRQEDNLIQENKELRRRTFRYFGEEDYWIWQTDGENYLESLICPIAIAKQDLEVYVQQRISEVK